MCISKSNKLNERRKSYTKKNNEFHELTVRFDNAALAEKLSEMFSHGNYASKNRLIMDLLWEGIDARTKADALHRELDTVYKSLDERQSESETRRSDFEKTVYEQLRELRRENDVTEKVLGFICHLLEAIYFGDIVTKEELGSGFYETLPVRFWRSA